MASLLLTVQCLLQQNVALLLEKKGVSDVAVMEFNVIFRRTQIPWQVCGTEEVKYSSKPAEPITRLNIKSLPLPRKLFLQVLQVEFSERYICTACLIIAIVCIIGSMKRGG